MNGLEDTSTYYELLMRVPESLAWAVVEELDAGLELSMSVHHASLVSRSSGVIPDPSSDPFSDPDRFVTVGVLDPQRLRLGVQRLSSRLVELSPDLLFILDAATLDELTDPVIDAIVQAGMWGIVLV